MLKEEKEYFNKSVKQYRSLSKLCLLLILIPAATLIYCSVKSSKTLIPTLILGMVLFTSVYVGYMSLRIKADILEEIVTKPGFDEHSKTENQDDRHIPS